LETIIDAPLQNLRLLQFANHPACNKFKSTPLPLLQYVVYAFLITSAMFKHFNKTRTYSHILKIALLLSFVAGMVNLAGYLAVQKLTTI